MIEDQPLLRRYPRFSILYPQSQWSEPDSNGPLLLFRQALIRLSYPTSAADPIADCELNEPMTQSAIVNPQSAI